MTEIEIPYSSLPMKNEQCRLIAPEAGSAVWMHAIIKYLILCIAYIAHWVANGHHHQNTALIIRMHIHNHDKRVPEAICMWMIEISFIRMPIYYYAIIRIYTYYTYYMTLLLHIPFMIYWFCICMYDYTTHIWFIIYNNNVNFNSIQYE